MKHENIQAQVGTTVTADEMADMIRSQSVGTSPNDVRIRSGVLSLSFGPGGVVLAGAEQRTAVNK